MLCIVCVRYLVGSLVKTVSIVAVMYNPRPAVFFPVMLTEKCLRMVKVWVSSLVR